MQTKPRFARRVASRFALGRDGSVAPLVAATMPMLLGFAGLAIDAQLWFRGQQRLQLAADAAALGAARLLTNARATQADFNKATLTEANGVLSTFSGTLAAPTVTVGSGNSKVTVALSSTAPVYFTAMFLGSNTTTLKATATAVAPTSSLCMLALDTGGSAISATISATMTAKSCIIASNSTGTTAIYASSNSKISAQSLTTPGGYAAVNASYITPDPQTNRQKTADPYQGLTAPTPLFCNYTIAQNYSSGSNLMLPGTYCADVTISGFSTFVFMAGGTYTFLNSSLVIQSCSIMNGLGSSIYFGGSNPGNLSMSGNCLFQLAPANSGTSWLSSLPNVPGVAIYRDRSASEATTTISGGAMFQVNGAVYLPSGTLQATGGSTTIAPTSGNALVIVARDISAASNATITVGGVSGGPARLTQ